MIRGIHHGIRFHLNCTCPLFNFLSFLARGPRLIDIYLGLFEAFSQPSLQGIQTEPNSEVCEAASKSVGVRFCLRVGSCFWPVYCFAATSTKKEIPSGQKYAPTPTAPSPSPLAILRPCTQHKLQRHSFPS